ncbi:MAG: acyl-CoA reductase [Alphaproteobacteria bacterium]|nr:acyl-CoA reductase [Alphaproteobacteria bacterium]
MKLFRAGHVPGLDPQSIAWLDLGTRQAASAGIAVPVLSPGQIRTVTRTVRDQARVHLQTLSVTDIIERIDAAVMRLLNPADPARRTLDQGLPRLCGLDADMVRLNLNRYLKTFRTQGLHRFVAEDLPNPKVLDTWQPLSKGGWGLAMGSPVLLHLWAGNVPALPLWSLVCGLLSKSGNVGKLASAEPMFVSVFAQVLIDIEPCWRDVLALLWWEGGDTQLEAAAMAEAQTVIAYGADATLQALRGRLPQGVRLLEHGHKLSFGVVARDALGTRHGPELAQAAAQDMARYDQGGCYSPHLFFVQRGGPVPPREWAERLFHALQNQHARHPRRTPDADEAWACAQWRQAHEWSGQAVLMTSEGGDVAYLDAPPIIAPGPGLRCVQVVAIDDLSQVIDCIAPARRWLQTAGLAMGPQHWPEFSRQLGRAGVTRLCAIGAMAAPEAGWHHDGGHSLRDLLSWVEVERSLEDAAERHAPYAD